MNSNNNGWNFQQDNTATGENSIYAPPPSNNYQSDPYQNQQSDIHIPSKVKLDLDTPLETLFFWGMMTGFFVLLMALIGYLEDGATSFFRTAVTAGTLLSTIFGICYKNTDNYYILDSNRKAMLYHFKFFGKQDLSVFANFSQIHATTVLCRKQSSKHSSWWEYRTAMVLDSGKIVPLSDWKKYDFLNAMKKAKNFATLTGANLVESYEQSTVRKVRGIDGKYTFSVKPYSFFDSLGNLGTPILIIFSVAALGLLLHFLHNLIGLMN